MGKSSAFNWSLVLLALSPLAFYFTFLGAGAVVGAAASLWKVENYRLVPDLTIDNLRATLGNGILYQAILNSLRLASVTASLSLAIAVPSGFWISRLRSQATRAAILALLLLPFLTSYLARAMAWQPFFSRESPFAIGSWFADGILYSELAATLCLLSVTAPLATLFTTIGFQSVPSALLVASGHLGATALYTFRRIAVPLALPGIATGFALSFLLAFSDSVSVSVLGGRNKPYLATYVLDRLKISALAEASTAASVMALLALVIVLVCLALTDRASGFRPARRQRREA